MELGLAMAISAKGMKAQGTRMRVISENIANADTAPQTKNEAPYRRKVVEFKNELDRARGANMVKVDDIREDQKEFRLKYDPSHPAADERGYIRMPNVNSLVEVMDMREAQRSYEANLNAIEVSRTMLRQTLELLR